MPADLTQDFPRLFEGRGVDVFDYDCRGDNCTLEPEPVRDKHQFFFVRSGFFVVDAYGERNIADANSVVLFRDGSSYRTSHPAAELDTNTVVQVDTSTLRTLTDTPDDLSQPLETPWAVRPLARDAFVNHHALLDEIRAGCTDPDHALTIEEHSFALVAATLVPPSASPVRERPATIRAHRALVEHVKQLLSTDLYSPLTLDQIAEQVAWSPFDLTRLFKRHTGLPVHRYRRQLRLRTAYMRLTEGDEPIASIAHDLGFASHSHFTEAFRSEFGITPTTARGA